MLYGTTAVGGIVTFPDLNGNGTVFSYNLNTGNFTTVHQFTANGVDDGQYIVAGVAYRQGILYGEASSLPASIYQIDLSTGVYSLLHAFDGPGQGGKVTADSEPLFFRGYLYGSTNGVGKNNSGTVFKTDPVTGATTILHRFTAFPGNTNPNIGVSNLIFYNGRLYGTATPVGYNPTAVHGSIFSIKP